MVFCSVCQSLPPLAEFRQPEDHHTIQSLQISAKGGCELCFLIWESLSRMNSVQGILAGEARHKPCDAQVTLHYYPLSVLQQKRELAQYIWVSPSLHEEGGAMLELFVNRGEGGVDPRR